MSISENNLHFYFPMLRTRSQLLADIHASQSLAALFDSWIPEHQEDFLNFCTGVKGVKMTYDSFFKEILNPEYVPERLNDFLSVLLNQSVTVLSVLPNDSTRIATESSLLITDLVVQLEDGSIANIEIQKIGYHFPGERAACYSADLLLRQYKRVRDFKKKNFNYRDIKPVYTIVLFEQSPKMFHDFPTEYLHYVEPASDTGIKLNLLQKYLFIPLDIFRKTSHNKPITNKIDAWLTFLSKDEPEDILNLINDYPEFKSMYEDVYNLCLNTERIMHMFSKELQILDENTVRYMIDEMQNEINSQADTIASLEHTVSSQENTIASQENTIASQKNTIAELKKRISELEG